MSRPLDVLGASASNAGDEFHEAWALGHALKLLDPSSNLTELTVEGVRDAAETNDSANWDGVDCALYYDDDKNSENSRVELVQLKYSVTSPNKSWTLTRFCSSTKKTGNNSVARRLADAFKGAIKDKNPSQLEASLSLKLITNQPIAKKLQTVLALGASNKLDGNEYNLLKNATGLGKEQLVQFCKVLALEGGEDARAELRVQNTKAIAELVLSPVKDMADNLRVRIQELLGPERSRAVRRDTVLSWFNLGRGHGLFPCEPELEPLSETIPRSVTETLSSDVQNHTLVVLHGKGGCGKTTTARCLEASLPPGSRTIVYDCYGAGSYRDPSRPRHSSWQGFTQLSNELARLTNTPLFFPYKEREDMAPLFRQKLETAAGFFGRENPDSLLVIVIDAADNISTHAAEQTPPQKCFVDQLVAFTDLPPNVRILVTCRTSRLSRINLPDGTKEVLCPEFSIIETKAMVALHCLEGSEITIGDFHALSRSIPRVQTSALAGASSLADAVEFLRPNGKSLNDLFDAKVREAFDRSGVNMQRSYWCAALDELSSPIPIDVLSKVCGLDQEVIDDIVNDLAPNLRLGDRGVEFSNEDFEEYSEHIAKDATEAVRSTIAEVLVSERLNSSYAASHLFDALIACGRKSEMGRFLREKDGTAAISDPIVRRRVDLSRLRAALHIASNDQNEIAVGETIFVGVEAMRTSGKVDDLIKAYSDLSAAFLEETISVLVLNDPEERSKQGSVLFHLAREKVRQGKPFECRLNLRAAEEWMHQTFNDENQYRNWSTQRRDIVTEQLTFFALRGWPLVEKDCDRWTNTSFCIALRKWVLAKIVVEFGSGEIPKILEGLDLRYHFLAINSLCRAGVTPTAKQRENALAGLSSFDFEMIERDEGIGSGPSVVAEIQAEILFFLEGLVPEGKIWQEDTKRILSKLRGDCPRNIQRLHLTYPYPIDFALRTAILTSLSCNEEPDLKSVFTEPLRPQEEERTPESERNFKLDKERYDEICGLLPAYKAYATLLVGRTSGAVEQLSQMISSLGGPDSRSYEFSYVKRILQLRATDLLVSSDFDQHTKATFLRASLVDKESFGDQEAQLCEHVLHDSAMHSIVADALDQKSKEIRNLHVRATEKSDYLLSIARVFMDFSRDHASAVFLDALKIAEEVDLEALDVLHALCRIVNRERPDTPATRELLGVFARVVRHAGDLLQSEDGFPLDEALEAITVSSPPVGAMTASRWGDEGFSTRCNEIMLFIKSTLETGWLGSADGYALAQILGDLPPQIEDTVLKGLDEVPEDTVDRLLSHLVERKILDTTPYSDAHVPRILAELCRSKPTVTEPWSRLQGIRQLKSNTLPLLKSNSEKANTWKPEATKQKDADKVAWNSVDPLSADSIIEAREADRRARSFDFEERLLELRKRVRFSDRTRHLDALSQCARASKFPVNELEAIFSALDDWSDRVISEWCRTKLPKLTVDLGGRAMGYGWYDKDQLSELQARAGLPAEGRRQVVLDLVEQNAAKLGAQSLLKLLAEYVKNLDQHTADELLARLIDQTQARLKMGENAHVRYSFDPQKLPSTKSEVLSALIYRYLGDIDSRVRWQASHAFLCAVQLGLSSLIKGVFDQAVGPFNRHYTFPDCPFQEMNADHQLSLVLARVSSQNPEIIEKHEADILKIWDKNKPHILIGHFLARALCQARERDANLQVDEIELASMNGSASERTTRLEHRYESNFNRRADQGSRFSFDSMDIVPYWYAPACRIFANLSVKELIQVAESWIVDSWGGHKETNHWVNEPRKSRLRDEEFGLYSASHGSRPTIHRHSVYLQWHGLHMAVGELLKNRPLVELNHDDYDTLEGWLERYSTTYPTIWLADLLKPLPLSSGYWKQPEPDRDEWVFEVDTDDPMEELIGEDGSLTLCQYRVHAIYKYGEQAASSEVRSQAAFVPSKTAPALLRAYAATTNYYDVFIPDSNDFGVKDGKNSDFTMIPAVDRSTGHRDAGIDTEDSRCFQGRSVQAIPSKALLDVLKIPSGPLWSSTWSIDDSGPADLNYRAWSKTSSDSGRSMRRASYSYIDGYRLSITQNTLQNSMNALGCDLILTVNLERSIGSDYGQRSKESAARTRVEVIRFDRDGTYETRSGYRGSWTQNHQRVG